MMRFSSLISGIALLASGAFQVQSAPPRVDMNEALRQLIKMVEPVVPPAAAAARVGGTVVTEAIIRVNGTVESVRVLGGPEPLHQAAIDAVKQWTFTPFLRNGKPARVMALLDVKFPDPAGDEASRRNRAAFGAVEECRQQQRAPTAEAVCAKAARLADEDEPRAFLLRASARASYAVALLRAGKAAAALQEFDVALKLRLENDPDEADADNAEILAMMAVAQMTLGQNAAAEATLLRAEKAFEGALKRVPELRDNYLPRFASVLQVHARLKQTMGQADAAAALERRAAGLISAATPPPPPPPGPRNPPSLRTVGGLQCLCTADVDDAAVKRALGAVPAAFRPWLIETSFGGSFQLYGAATATGTDYRIGPVSMLSRGSPGDPNAPPLFGAFGSWIQLPAPPPGSTLPSPNVLGWPVRVSWTLEQGPLTPAGLAGLVRFMRFDAASSVAAGQPAIKPWRIAEISHRGSLDFAVQLVDPTNDPGWPSSPAAPGVQTVILRRSDARWTVIRVEGR